MPPLTSVTIGVVINPMTQNQIYSCPARACYIFSQGTAPQLSNDDTNWVAVPANNVVASKSIRSTGVDTILLLKAV